MRLLLTSVTKPFGIDDEVQSEFSTAEHIHDHLTKNQELWSVRAVLEHWQLDLLAFNSGVRATVMQFPTLDEVTRELQAGGSGSDRYTHLGINVVTPTFPKAEAMARRARLVRPDIEVIYGGFPPEPGSADALCRGEGVAFLRDRLGRAPGAIRHPPLFAASSLMGYRYSSSIVLLDKIGCSRGCDFCCTSAYHDRRETYLLRTPEDFAAAVVDNSVSGKYDVINIMNEDFLRDKDRVEGIFEILRHAFEIPPEFFTFSAFKSVDQYEPEELYRMGIETIWVGFEDGDAPYRKNDPHRFKERIAEYREAGIGFFISSIFGFPHQDRAGVLKNMRDVLSLEPVMTQFGILTPYPGTPLRKAMEGTITCRDYRYYDAHHLVFEHPHIARAEMESLQQQAQTEDLETLGPSLFRHFRAKLNGIKHFGKSRDPLIRKRVEKERTSLGKTLGLFAPGIRSAPSEQVREQLRELESDIVAELGPQSNYWPYRLGVEYFVWRENRERRREAMTGLPRQPRTVIRRYDGDGGQGRPAR